MFAARASAALLVLSLVWGALSFGGVYPWAYWPLTIACGGVGALSFVVTRVSVPGLGRIAVALGAVAAFIVLQLVPVPAAVLADWSPARDALLKRYDVLYALTAPEASHALSIDVAGTRVALACFVAFGLALLGTARLVSASGPIALVRGVVAFGLALAVFAVVQDVALTGHTGEFHTIYIYGFWPDPYVNKPFGPFINKNNFAGWMLMTIPVTLGFVAARWTELGRTTRTGLRSRVLALSSRRGADVVFAIASATAMGVSLFMSMSRSAMIALAATVVGIAWFAPESTGASRRVVRLGIAGLLLLGLAAWAGAGAIADRFADRSEASMRGRFVAWSNAVRLAREFPVFGVGVNAFGAAMILDQRGDAANFWEEAHNDYLQIAAEGGVVGVAMAALALAAVGIEIRRRFRDDSIHRASFWIRFGAVAGLAAIGIQELVEFSLQIPGNAALFAVLIGIALHVQPPPSRSTVGASP